MAKMGAAIEAAIARISKKQIQPALKELRAAVRRVENSLRRQASRPARGGATGRGGGVRGPRIDAGPTMSPQEVKSLRARLGMTQAEFARETGVTHVAVYFWESGRTKPAGQRLLRLRQLEAKAGGGRKSAARGGARKKRATKRRARA